MTIGDFFRDVITVEQNISLGLMVSSGMTQHVFVKNVQDVSLLQIFRDWVREQELQLFPIYAQNVTESLFPNNGIQYRHALVDQEAVAIGFSGTTPILNSPWFGCFAKEQPETDLFQGALGNYIPASLAVSRDKNTDANVIAVRANGFSSFTQVEFIPVTSDNVIVEDDGRRYVNWTTDFVGDVEVRAFEGNQAVAIQSIDLSTKQIFFTETSAFSIYVWGLVERDSTFIYDNRSSPTEIEKRLLIERQDITNETQARDVANSILRRRTTPVTSVEFTKEYGIADASAARAETADTFFRNFYRLIAIPNTLAASERVFLNTATIVSDPNLFRARFFGENLSFSTSSRFIKNLAELQERDKTTGDAVIDVTNTVSFAGYGDSSPFNARSDDSRTNFNVTAIQADDAILQKGYRAMLSWIVSTGTEQIVPVFYAYLGDADAADTEGTGPITATTDVFSGYLFSTDLRNIIVNTGIRFSRDDFDGKILVFGIVGADGSRGELARWRVEFSAGAALTINLSILFRASSTPTNRLSWLMTHGMNEQYFSRAYQVRMDEITAVNRYGAHGVRSLILPNGTCVQREAAYLQSDNEAVVTFLVPAAELDEQTHEQYAVTWGRTQVEFDAAQGTFSIITPHQNNPLQRWRMDTFSSDLVNYSHLSSIAQRYTDVRFFVRYKIGD